MFFGLQNEKTYPDNEFGCVFLREPSRFERYAKGSRINRQETRCHFRSFAMILQRLRLMPS